MDDNSDNDVSGVNEDVNVIDDHSLPDEEESDREDSVIQEIQEMSDSGEEFFDDMINEHMALLVDSIEDINAENTSDDDDDDVLEPSVDEERFDKQLNATHSYLGQDLEAVDGNLEVVEEETTLRIPICAHEMVVVPGQTVPLTVFYPQIVNQLKRARESNKTLGFVFSSDQLKPGGIGTTAVFQSYVVVSQNSHPSYDIVKAILQGKQRFRVKSVARIFDGTWEADVAIMPEWPASHPLDAYLTPTLARVAAADPWTEPSRVIATPAMDASGHAFRFTISSPSTRPRHRLNSRYVASPLAAHPAFVYRLYDDNILIRDIKKMLACLNATWSDELPYQSRPVEFSYWLTQTMPVSEKIKFHILSLPHYVQRLRACRSILTTSSEMVCETCGKTITSKQYLVNFFDEGSCKAFVNPGGVVHEMLTVKAVFGIRNVSSKHTEHSWFPGYAWTIIQCSDCNSHMGWKFTATKKTLHPPKFWGITRKAVRPKFKDQNWRPVN